MAVVKIKTSVISNVAILTDAILTKPSQKISNRRYPACHPERPE